MHLLTTLLATAANTAFAVVPIIAVLLGFQLLVLRRRLPNARRIALGCLWVFLGLTLFLVGLQEALFPIGRTMALQLTAPALAPSNPGTPGEPAVGGWWAYGRVYAFAAAIGFAAAIAEPALLAVALKANHVSAGTIPALGLRLAVAAGAAAGVTLGVLRLVLGWPMPVVLGIAYGMIAVQTALAPRVIVPVAYDVGGVTTSTVTVPVVAALGLGLASAIPGRSPLADGFGLIAFTCLCPIMSVLAFAAVADRLQRTGRRGRRRGRPDGAAASEDRVE